MTKRQDIKKILIIGAGPIVIGQACEFDYSGTQACNALRAAGYYVILVNSNAATIMNDKNLANRTYIEPLTVEFLEKIIIQEKPDAILPTVGGQTALNLAVQLEKSGILKKYNVKMIGAKLESIEKAEDRALFSAAMKKIGLTVPYNVTVKTLEEANSHIDKIGLPAIIRPSFTMGGTGSGIAYNIEEFQKMIVNAIQASPVGSTQIDQSILGFKEYELEVMRDKNGNFLVICSIENIDPMGIHTGDSITVAPALTLTDKEYQIMRNAAKSIIEEIGIETGGANVQFAVNPTSGQLLIVEMNPRVSRSSALASKATGYPIAKFAALVAVGFTLDEIMNDCTSGIPASFEPAIDYIVAKIPRFNFEKFPNQNEAPELSTSMQSVGEVMAIGTNFKQALQKAICSLEEGIDGVYSKENKTIKFSELKKEELLLEISRPIPNRLLKIADCLRAGATIHEIIEMTNYDRWFLEQIEEIVNEEKIIILHGIKTHEELFNYKKSGFSDARLAFLSNKTRDDIYQMRQKLNIAPSFKRVDSCAAEFDVKTNYLYSSYIGNSLNVMIDEVNPSTKKKVIIIGSGCNRIGQGIEFDYSCVHASWAIKAMGYESIMINCNPETVSTDYEVSDKLYFEPLDIEHVMEIINKEKASGELLGVIVQFGGQTSLKLVQDLVFYNITILGTSADSLDIAEDRGRFKELLSSLDLKQPESLICNNEQELLDFAPKVGFPVLLRPSNVLGGRAMAIIYKEEQIKFYLKENPYIFETGSVLIDQFLDKAFEVDVDAVSDGQEVMIAGIMEHIEEAGVHSGDSVCVTPPPYLSAYVIDKIKEITIKLTLALKVVGIINIQFAIKDDIIYIIEANPRASRTVPFISKFANIPFAQLATQMMCGGNLSFSINEAAGRYAVKMPVFPFLKFKDADCNLGPEMKSTGESMGIDKNFEAAFAKAFIGAHGRLPSKGNVLISVRNDDKTGKLIDIANELIKNNFVIYATKHTAKFLQSHDIPCELAHKVREGRPNIMDLIINNKITLYINTSDNFQAIREGLMIRRAALMRKIPCIRTISHAFSLVKAISYANANGLEVRALQDY